LYNQGSSSVKLKIPENDFRKRIQHIENTNVIFYNPAKKIHFSEKEIQNNPGIWLTFIDDSNQLMQVFEHNLSQSIIFEFKLFSSIKKCLDQQTDLISDDFFLKCGNFFSFYMESMLDYELLSISELDHILRIWNQYLILFLERFTEFDDENCFEILETLNYIFQNLSVFFDLRYFLFFPFNQPELILKPN
jgi:hypothetical protein